MQNNKIYINIEELTSEIFISLPHKSLNFNDGSYLFCLIVTIKTNLQKIVKHVGKPYIPVKLRHIPTSPSHCFFITASSCEKIFVHFTAGDIKILMPFWFYLLHFC